MNGFEPLRRRIIDYTEAGQWSEVYDGPLEDCESEKLKAENAKLVMKLNAEHIVRQNMERENAKLRELVARMAHVLRADDEWTDPFYCNPYCADEFRCRSDDCVEVECPIVKRMRELGVEV